VNNSVLVNTLLQYADATGDDAVFGGTTMMITQLIESQVIDPYHLQLSHPIQAIPHSKVIVAVMAADDLADEREFWYQLSDEGLAMAYGDDEPDYSLAVIREPNPEYKP
jgi:hypothetical protein